MAVGAVLDHAVFASTTDASSYSETSGWTPVSGTLYLVTVSSRIATVQPVVPAMSFSGTGLTTFAEVVTEPRGTLFRSTMFRVRASGSPTSGVITADFTSQGANQAGCFISVLAVSGEDTGGTNGSAAIVQASGSNGSSTNAPSYTFPTAVSTSNAAVVGYHSGGNVDNAPPGGWTELADTALSSPTQSQEMLFRADAVNTVTPQDNVASWVIVAAEIAAAAGGGGGGVSVVLFGGL